MNPTFPHTCKFCGAPSQREPGEQDMPVDYCHEADHLSFDDDVTINVKLPWVPAIASFLISVAAAWLVCHLLDYRFWFPIGMTTYTLVGFACYWAFDIDNHEVLVDTQPENKA